MEYEKVLVDKADLEGLINRVNELEKRFEETIQKMENKSNLQQRIDALQKDGMLTASAICKLVNWSTRTFYRRVENGEIPVILEGGTRYKMSVDVFTKWYEKSYIQ